MKLLLALFTMAAVPLLAGDAPAPGNSAAVKGAQYKLGTPQDFGGVGDGVVDDSEALQKALNSGRVVHLPDGRFRITQRLEIPARGGLTGSGTVFQDFDNSTVPGNPGTHLAALCITGDEVLLDGFRIEKKFIDGSYACGIVAKHVKGVRFRNLDISGYSARYGIHGNVIRDTGSPGSFGIPGAQRVRYSGPHAIELHDDGCRHNVVVGNVITDTQTVRTTASGVRNNAGTTNVEANNLFHSGTRGVANTELPP